MSCILLLPSSELKNFRCNVFFGKRNALPTLSCIENSCETLPVRTLFFNFLIQCLKISASELENKQEPSKMFRKKLFLRPFTLDDQTL